MAGVPEFCEQCGKQVQAASINIVGNSELSVKGAYGRCPHCGGRTRVIEGVFDFRDGLIEMLSGPRWSRERLRQLQATLRDAQAAQADVGETIARVAEVDPELGGWFMRTVVAGWTKDDTWKLIGAILAALAIIVPAMKPSGVSPEEVREIVRQQIEEHERASPEEPPPPGQLPPTAP